MFYLIYDEQDNFLFFPYKDKQCCLILGQDVDHTYYTSKIYGPGVAASDELWVHGGELWKVCAFLSSSYRQTEVGICLTVSSEHPFFLPFPLQILH